MSDTIHRLRSEVEAAQKENERLETEMRRRMRRRIVLLEERLDAAGIKVPRA